MKSTWVLALAPIALGMLSGQSAPATTPDAAPAGVYKLDPAHTSVIGRISHFGLSGFSFRFDKTEATYRYDPAHPTASQIEVRIDPASINTGVAKLDAELAGEKFFDAAKFPEITFRSTAVRVDKGNTGVMAGNLTFRGVTKPIEIAVTYNGTATPMNVRRMGFSGTTTIKRSDYGMTALAGAVGDEVDLKIETEFVHQP